MLLVTLLSLTLLSYPVQASDEVHGCQWEAYDEAYESGEVTFWDNDPDDFHCLSSWTERGMVELLGPFPDPYGRACGDFVETALIGRDEHRSRFSVAEIITACRSHSGEQPWIQVDPSDFR